MTAGEAIVRATCAPISRSGSIIRSAPIFYVQIPEDILVGGVGGDQVGIREIAGEVLDDIFV